MTICRKFNKKDVSSPDHSTHEHIVQVKMKKFQIKFPEAKNDSFSCCNSGPEWNIFPSVEYLVVINNYYTSISSRYFLVIFSELFLRKTESLPAESVLFQIVCKVFIFANITLPKIQMTVFRIQGTAEFG